MTDNIILNVGKVVSVKGRKVDILVYKSKNTSSLIYNGEVIKNVSVGSYVKISKGFEELIGKVDGESIIPDRSFDLKEYRHRRDKIVRILNVSLMGYFEKSIFRQGLKNLPLIENECYLLTNREFNRVHQFVKKINGKPDVPIDIGVLANEKGQRIAVGVNSLFASHIGIFGNTGSGKSYTLAGLYYKLFKKYSTNTSFKENAKFLLIDFNGEYLTGNENDNIITSFENKKIYNLTTRKESDDKYPITEKEIRNVDFWSIFLTATEKTQKPFLKRALSNSYYPEQFKSSGALKTLILNIFKRMIIAKIEKGVILQFLSDIDKSSDGITLMTAIRSYTDHLKWHGKNQKYYFYDNNRHKTCYEENEEFFQEIRGILSEDFFIVDNINYLEKIRLSIIFLFYDEFLRYGNPDHIAPLIKRLKHIDELNRLITVSDKQSNKFIDIISLANVNTSMKKTLPLLICKQIYDQKKYERNDKKFLNLIIDEAHNILSHNSQRESELWKDYRLETFEEIIKEGRKFGVFLTLASQRPSDISSTIISQLHNYFLHRLINNKDIEAIERTVSYLDTVSFDSLPILPTGSCILAGLSAQVPVIIEIDKIEDSAEPYNKTIRPTDFWDENLSTDSE